MEQPTTFTLTSERMVCSQCGALQPHDWKPGDLCVQCGGTVRGELRCAWCTRWTPEGKYCRQCGTEVMSPNYFGAARMLKNAGVDQFSLPERLQELAPEQLENFERLYQKHFALLLQRKEEVHICQKYLIQQDHDIRLEEKLLPLLPFDEKSFATYSGEKLLSIEDIRQKSPIFSNQMLATLACLRSGTFEQTERGQEEIFQQAESTFNAEEKEIVLEAALAFAHWRMKTWPFNKWVPWQKVAQIAEGALDKPLLQGWAAVACWPVLLQQEEALQYQKTSPQPPSSEEELKLKLQKNKLEQYLKEAIQSKDEDLCLSASLCLEDEKSIASFLNSLDKAKKQLAAIFLAQKKSSLLLSFLKKEETELLQSVMYLLKNPLPQEFISLFIDILDHKDSSIVRQYFKLLEPNFTPQIIERVIAKASIKAQQQDFLLFELLLKSKLNPELENEREKVINASLEFASAQDVQKEMISIYESISSSYDLPDSLIEKLKTLPNMAQYLLALIKIAEEQVKRNGSQSSHSFLIETVFNNTETEIIGEAIWGLIRAGKQYNSTDFVPFSFTIQSITAHFSLHDFLFKFSQILTNQELLQRVGVYDWVSELIDSYDIPAQELKTIDPAIRTAFFDALLKVVQEDYWLILRTRSARFFGKSAAGNPGPTKYAAALETYMQKNELLFDLSSAISYAIEELRKNMED